MMIDSERFSAALERAYTEGSLPLGIGTLSEKPIHRVLKLYFEPDESKHEVEYLGFVADIMNDGGITEIQRAGFARLETKLRRFLPEQNVTVVYPLIAERSLGWVDPQTGLVDGLPRRVTGKTVYDAARELAHISEHIGNERLRVIILLLGCDELRALNGRGQARKIKAKSIDLIPRRIVASYELVEKRDYMVLLPDGLGEEFTAADFRRRCRSRSRYSLCALSLLCSIGLLEREKVGRAYVYRRTAHARQETN